MIYPILHWMVSALAVLGTAYFIPGFKVTSFMAALFTSAGIGLVNALLGPALMFLTLPINIITFGLFTFVVNGAILKISAALVPGFEIESWWAAIFGAIILAVIDSILHALLI